MYSNSRFTYARRIEIVRICVAVLFASFSTGLLVCANLRLRSEAVFFGYLALASLVAAFGLFVEYLVRSWIEIRRNGGAVFRFTLGELFILMAAIAVPLGLFRALGAMTIPVLVLSLVCAACGLETIRRKRSRVAAHKAELVRKS